MRGVAAPAVVLWAGTLTLGLSTVILLAVFSRFPNRSSFVGLSALLALSFASALLPAGVQLRSAAFVTDGRGVPRLPVWPLATLAVVAVIASPGMASALHLPVLAVLLVVVQMVVAVQLASRRGVLLGLQRFGALGVNLALESGFRVALGIVLGLALGLTGLAAGLCLGTVVATGVLPSVPRSGPTAVRPVTPLFDATVALILLAVLVQLDVLLAPTALSSAAKHYDLAAVPAKGVYLVLFAAGPLIFPFARRGGGRRLLVRATVATLAIGLLVSAVLVAARPLISLLLGQAEPSLGLLSILAVAMSVAGATAVVVNAGVARGVLRPWPPLALGLIGFAGFSLSRPGPYGFALASLAVQVLTGLACLVAVASSSAG